LAKHRKYRYGTCTAGGLFSYIPIPQIFPDVIIDTLTRVGISFGIGYVTARVMGWHKVSE